MGKKPRVVFAFTEAGLGHIMPLKSIVDAFNEKYGDKVEIVRSNFFTETNKKPLIKYEDFLINEVKKHNKHNWYGYATTFIMEIFGSTIDNHAVMKWFTPKAYKEAIKHVDELECDLFVSTHWATNYYAVHAKSKPLTLTYVPDAFINPVFRYKSDLTLCSPRTHNMASTTLLLPLPLGPITAVIPSSNSNTVLSAKDLKPCISILFR